MGIRLIGVIASIVLAFLAQRVVAGSPYEMGGWLVYGIAGLLLVASAQRLPRPAARPPGGASQRPRRFAALALLALGTASLAAVPSLQDWSPVSALVSWIAGLIIGSVALRGWVITTPNRAPQPWSRPELLGFAIVVGLAALSRLLWIDELPRRYFDDEARVGVYLLSQYGRRVPNFFSLGWNDWPVLGISAQGMLAPLLGLSTTSLRLFSALMGTLAVAATYVLTRELLKPRSAFLAAAFLAIGRTAIDFSRLGVCHAQTMFLVPLAFALWWRGVNSGRASNYFWAGIALALCAYGYNAGQLAFPLWLAWLIVSGLTRREAFRQQWRRAAPALAGFAMTIMPLFLHVTEGLSFGARWESFHSAARNRQMIEQLVDTYQSQGLERFRALVGEQIGRTWLGFTSLPAKAYELGYRGGGMLDDVSAALFVLGLALSLSFRLGWPVAFVLFWWCITVVVGGAMTRDPPAFVRLVGALPAVAILAALPIEALLRTASAGRLRSMLGLAMAGGLLVAASWYNWRTYFVEFASQELDLKSQLARTVNDLPADLPVLLCGSEYAWHAHGWTVNQLTFSNELFRTDFRDRVLTDVADTAHFLPVRVPNSSGGVAVILGATQRTLLPYLRTLYPEARLVDVGSGDLLLHVATLSPADLAKRQGLLVKPVDHDEPGGLLGPANPFDDASPDESNRNFAWTGQVYWPVGRKATVRVRASKQLVIEIGDETITTEPGAVTERDVDLERGWQPIAIQDLEGGKRGLTISIISGSERFEVMSSDLRPEIARQGLRGLYEQNGRIVERTIDPQLNMVVDERLFDKARLPITMPFRVEWRGSLCVPRTGKYTLELQTSGPASVTVDNQRVIVVGRLGADRPEIARVTRKIEAGSRSIIASWDSTTSNHHSKRRRVFQLYWTPPGGTSELIPPSNFSPSQEGCERPPSPPASP